MDEILLILRAETQGRLGWDFLFELNEHLKARGISCAHVSKEAYVRMHGPAIARKIGMTGFLLSQTISESVIPSGSVPDALDFLALYAAELCATESLTIVDPYFFASIRGASINPIFDRVIGPILPSIDRLKVVHSARKADNLPDLSCHIGLSWPHLKFSTEVCEEVHDRFWIADQTQALVIGTSLNSFGSKFCFVERLSNTDVQDLLGELAKLGVAV